MTIKSTIKALLLVVLVAAGLQGNCQDINQLLKEADQLQASHKDNDAYRKYQEVLKVQPKNLFALCKASELCSLIGNTQAEKPARINYFNTARRYAATALQMNPNNPEANFVMSVAMGRLAIVLNGGEKIQAINDIKKYAEIAIRNDPDNFKALHVLGKWHYEVSSLNAFQRMGVKLVYGGLPPSSFDQSIKYYEKSRALKPDFTLNYLEVAKAYHKNKQYNKAMELLQKLQSMPVKSADDPAIKKEGNELLKEWKSS